jgi:hypothetical protein
VNSRRSKRFDPAANRTDIPVRTDFRGDRPERSGRCNRGRDRIRVSRGPAFRKERPSETRSSRKRGPQTERTGRKRRGNAGSG